MRNDILEKIEKIDTMVMEVLVLIDRLNNGTDLLKKHLGNLREKGSVDSHSGDYGDYIKNMYLLYKAKQEIYHYAEILVDTGDKLLEEIQSGVEDLL